MALSDARKKVERARWLFLFAISALTFFICGGFSMSDYRALYRKWRPRDFDGVCGQDAITDILKYEVANNKLSHAYLFSGSRGTGKTSCAKILSKAVNCHNPRGGNPCNECEACRSIDAGIATDVIEMDAASNNGIGDVRDMQDEIAFTPALLKYRVYIIDEVHMMSQQAFNALLKTLEEPPTYVIFILATTEYNKLPTTIVSRCQRFDFRRISTEIIMNRLLEMSRLEGIMITEDAARVIARISRGGMRDAISLLELCAGAHTQIDEQLVFSTVGSGNRDSAYKLISAIGRSDFSTVYGIVDDIVMKSGDLSVFWQEIIDSYRDILVVKNSENAKRYLDLTDTEYSALSEIASSFTPARLFYHVSLLESAMADMQRAFNSKRSIAEIALTRMCEPKLTMSCEALALRIEELEKELSMMRLGIPTDKKPSAQPTPDKQISATPVKAAAPQSPKAPSQEGTVSDKPVLYELWGTVIDKIRDLKSSLASCIASASVYKYPNGGFLIRLGDFFAKKLSSDEKDMAIVRGFIAETEGKSPSEITLKIESMTRSSGNPFSEIENALSN